MPVGYEFEDVFEQINSREYQKQGVKDSQVGIKREHYGTNEHKVDIPNYFSYMFDILTKPFFLLQYIICITLALENLIIYVYLYIAFSLTTTTINYILLYLSFLKIRDIA